VNNFGRGGDNACSREATQFLRVKCEIIDVKRCGNKNSAIDNSESKISKGKQYVSGRRKIKHKSIFDKIG
jgi:hypothetical protein